MFAQIPLTGLQGDWPLDGNANDVSGNGNNGTIFGATPTTDRFGNTNHAYKFNGSNTRIVVPNSTTVDFSNTTDFTINIWLKTYAADADGIPLCKNQYGGNNGYLFFTNNTNPGYCTLSKHASFYSGAGSSGDACSDNQVCGDTTWRFLTGVYTYATNKTYLYVNGVQQTDIGTAIGNRTNTQPLVFGSHSNGTNLFYNGCIDGVRIYNRALTTTEILQLYNEANPNSINEFANNQINVALFPNPGNGNFQLNYEVQKEEKTNIEVYDATGNIIYKEIKDTHAGVNTCELNLENFSTGMYYVKLTVGSKYVVKKISLNK